MSYASRSGEKLRWGAIDQDREICRSEAIHNLINFQERNPNLDQNETDKGPIHTVEGLNQVQFEDEGTDILCFNSMESLFYNTDRLNNLMVLKEAILFLGDTRV